MSSRAILDDDAAECGTSLHVLTSLLALELVVNLAGALPQKEQAPQEEDEIAAGEGVAERAEQRPREPHDAGEGEQQEDARHHGEREAHGTGARLLAGGQLTGQDRDENDVVDAEDDLEHREREQRDPGFGGGEPLQLYRMLRLKMRERNGVARKRQATTSRDVVNTKASRETVNTVPRDASVLRSRLTPLLDVVLHFRSWRRPTLPRPRSRSTIGADRLNDRVRDGNGCGPVALVASKDPDNRRVCW